VGMVVYAYYPDQLKEKKKKKILDSSQLADCSKYTTGPQKF
jgi:hypothetical protein